MNTKNTYLSKRTDKLIKRVLPDNFKISNDKNSNGHKYLNALYSPEIESLHDRLDYADHMSNIELFDYGSDSELYEVYMDHDLTTASGVYGGSIYIKLTDKAEFYDGDPTRLDLKQLINISGVPLSVVGLEYLRTDRTGSGHLLISYDIEAKEAALSGINPQAFVRVDDLGNFDNTYYDSRNVGIKTQSYDALGEDELLVPLGFNYQKKTYPKTKKVRLPINGDEITTKNYIVDAFEPSEYVWDEQNLIYVPTYDNLSNFTNDNGQVIYNHVYLNNPNGSGIFDTEYIDLKNIPISGTMRLFDIDNLDDNLEMIEISTNGSQLYNHSGKYYVHEYEGYNVLSPYSGSINIGSGEVATGISGWIGWDNVVDTKRVAEYIGYNSGVPQEYVFPTFSGVVIADPYLVTSWDHSYEFDGLNELFNWIEHPTNEITNRIKIVNGISRYVVEYDYQIFKNVNYITSSSATRFIKNDDRNYLFSKTNLLGEVEIPNKISRDPRPAVTFDPSILRPGSTLDELNINMDVTFTKEIDNKSIIAYLNNQWCPGYNSLGHQNSILVPRIDDPNTYVLNFIEDTPTFSSTIGSGITQPIQYGLNVGRKVQFEDGYYDSASFISLESPYNKYNRYFYIRYRNNWTPKDTYIYQSGDIDTQFYIQFRTDGKIVVADNNIITITDNDFQELFIGNDIEIIIETNWKHEIDVTQDKYNVFACIYGNKFTLLPSEETANSSELSFNSGTRLLEDAYMDIHNIKIYDRMEY